MLYALVKKISNYSVRNYKHAKGKPSSAIDANK